MEIDVLSAGIESHGINPIAQAVMAESGVDISRQRSTTLTPDTLTDLDLVVTLCGHADDNCPVLSKDVEKRHWPLDDPAATDGTEEEIFLVFICKTQICQKNIVPMQFPESF